MSDREETEIAHSTDGMERCDVCEKDVHSASIAHRGLKREEFDKLCYNCSVTILSLCKLDNIALDRMKKRSQDTDTDRSGGNK